MRDDEESSGKVRKKIGIEKREQKERTSTRKG
jgi:hypothetical protein